MFSFARSPSNSSTSGRIVARLPITLPEPTNDPRVLKVLGLLLVEHAPSDGERRQSQAVATFSGLRSPAIFGASVKVQQSGYADGRALYEVFAGAADLPRTGGPHAFARELDPDEPSSVMTDAVVAIENSDWLTRRLHAAAPPAPELIAPWVPAIRR